MSMRSRTSAVKRYTADGRAVRLASMLVAVTALGEAGHLLLDQMNADVAHHLFHFAFPLAAAIVFAWFVGRDIRARGWPTFSWSLDPTPRRLAGAHQRSDTLQEGQVPP